MSALLSVANFADRASDWLNPILVKETRQALKSRQFVATFLLMLIASWMISVLGIVYAGPGVEYQPVGGAFFFYYYIVLAVAIFLVVPFGAFRSLLSERDLYAWEVLNITTLSPRQVVCGKLTSAVVQMFIYYSAITPFIAFANLLKGVDVATIAFVLVASVLWSLALSMAALTASTFGSHRYWQVFLTLSVIGWLLVGLGGPLALVGSWLNYGSAFDDPRFWWSVAVVACYMLSFCVLALQVAIAQLTFDADNRSTRVRLACAGIFWMTLAWGWFWIAFSGRWGLPRLSSADIEGMLRILGAVVFFYWAVVGLFIVSEPDELSRRVRRGQSRNALVRFLASPFLPGGDRGLVFSLLHVTAFTLLAWGVSTRWGAADIRSWRCIGGMWCYFVFYLGLGAVLGRLVRSNLNVFRPAHARVLAVLALALGALLPQALFFFRAVGSASLPTNRAIYFVTDPFSTLYRLSDDHRDSNLLMVVLAFAAACSLLLNLRAMLVAVFDVVFGQRAKADNPPIELLAPQGANVVT